jgi:hypothetical protein
MTPMGTVAHNLWSGIGTLGVDAPGTEWFVFLGLNPGWALFAAVLCGLLIYWIYGKRYAELNFFQRSALVSLRAAFVAVLFFILTEPTSMRRIETVREQTLLVLQDVSLSMGISDSRISTVDKERVRIVFGEAMPEETSEPSRLELAAAVAANDQLKLWGRLAKTHKLKFAAFSQELGRIETVAPDEGSSVGEAVSQLYESYTVRDAQTSLSNSLREAVDQLSGEPVSAVMLISDGVNTAGPPIEEAVRYASRIGLPVYAYSPGADRLRDLSVSAVRAPAMVLENESVVLAVRLEGYGFSDQLVELRLIEGGSVVKRKQVRLEAEGVTTTTITCPGFSTGLRSLVLEVDELEGESVAENNKAELSLKVRSSKLRVLLIERVARWDFRYLFDTLRQDPRVDVNAVMLDGDSSLGSDPQSRFLPELPKVDELLKYQVVVIGDVDPARFPVSYLDAFQQLARQVGGGVLFHAGRHYNPVAFKGSDLEDLFPVELVTNSKTVNEELQKLELTAEGMTSDIMRLRDQTEENEELWASFPPVSWVANSGSAKPLADVLLVAPGMSLGSEAAQPVLARMQVGRGQTFYIGFDETWRWRSRVGREHYLKIWGQIFFELGMDRMLGASDRVQFVSDKEVYHRNEEVVISGRVFSEEFELLEASSIPARIEIRSGESDASAQQVKEILFVPVPDQVGYYTASFPATEPGHYTLKTELDPPAELSFLVKEMNRELHQPELDLESLRLLCEETGGRLLREEDLHRMPEWIKESQPPTVSNVTQINLGLTPLVYFSALALLCGEWGLRRFWGLK